MTRFYDQDRFVVRDFLHKRQILYFGEKAIKYSLKCLISPEELFMVDAKKILIVGATGYIGRKLLQKLDMRGNLVRCFARSSHQLSGHISSRVELMCGDVLDPDCLLEATTGIHTAYYFIHCMGSRSRISFEIQDRKAAENFVDACQKNGVSRIIYLGGLGRGKKLSAHLRSRQEVGEILRRSGIDVIEFRASIVIGAGSLSFEMVRALVELFPILLAPKGVEVLSQPIAVEDVLEYLLKALKCESRGPQIFEIGGKEQVSYANIMKEYAKQRGLKRHIIPLQFCISEFYKILSEIFSFRLLHHWQAFG